MSTTLLAAYDKAHFIARFKAIGLRYWRTGAVPPFSEGKHHPNGCGCALWHCGERWDDPDIVRTDESKALRGLLDGVREGRYRSAAQINDGSDPVYQQRNPRARILAALKDLP